MKYVLDVFASMTSGHKTGVKTQQGDQRHRLIQGFTPAYTELARESSDANFKQKVNPPRPLVLSAGLTTVQSKSSKYPTVMIPNEGDALGSVIYSTDLWEFFIDDASETSLGIPTGTPTSNVGIDAEVFNGKILTSHPTPVTRLYHGAINATPAWAATTGNTVTAGVSHILKLFEDRCLVTDSSSGSFTRSDKVQIVLPDFSITTGITLGDTFNIKGIGNHQDRYALLFCEKTTSPRLYNHTSVFMWNLVAGDSYDQRFFLKGKYVCSAEKDGYVHAFMQVGGTLVAYVFNGGAFQELGKMPNFLVSTTLNTPKTRIAVEGDYFVILGTSYGNTTAASPLYWNPYTGESFFALKAVASLGYKSLMIALDSSGVYNRYFSFSSGGSVGFLFKQTMESSTKADMGADYKSNFIPAPIVEGIHEDMGRMLIKQVEIEYNTAAPSSNDSIAFTLTYKDEMENETYSTKTATIKNTTANSTNASVGTKRAIVAVGANATEFSVDLAATVSTTSWDLIIRRIVIVYQPVALKS